MNVVQPDIARGKDTIAERTVRGQAEYGHRLVQALLSMLHNSMVAPCSKGAGTGFQRTPRLSRRGLHGYAGTGLQPDFNRTQAAFNACSRSSRKSSICSMPTDRRSMSSDTPALASSAGLSWRCVVDAGCVASDLASPILTRRVNSRRASKIG